MEIATIHFRLAPRADRDRALGALRVYLGALWRNGQKLRLNEPIARTRDGYAVFMRLPAADSLDVRHANKCVRRCLGTLAEEGFRAPRVRLLGPDPDGRPACSCRRRPFLILFTTCLHHESPVRCGGCFDPIPLYEFPTTDDAGDYRDVLRWQGTYQAMDRLWLESRAGEKFAHEQQALHDSTLSNDGREVARNLERRAHRRVYYYLSRYWGRSIRGERARLCPACGRAWRLKEPLQKILDLKCDGCRLVSSVARDFHP
jgi:predicted  nucleic acid-binding Zn ribbon protein